MEPIQLVHVPACDNCGSDYGMQTDQMFCDICRAAFRQQDYAKWLRTPPKPTEDNREVGTLAERFALRF